MHVPSCYAQNRMYKPKGSLSSSNPETNPESFIGPICHPNYEQEAKIQRKRRPSKVIPSLISKQKKQAIPPASWADSWGGNSMYRTLPESGQTFPTAVGQRARRARVRSVRLARARRPPALICPCMACRHWTRLRISFLRSCSVARARRWQARRGTRAPGRRLRRPR